MSSKPKRKTKQPKPITSDERRQLAKLAAFAGEPANYYRPPADWKPADKAEYTTFVGSFRVVFCIKVEEGRPHRHLSITGPGPASPDPETALTIASICGFSGGARVPVPHGEITVAPGSDWHLAASDLAHHVAIAQRLPA